MQNCFTSFRLLFLLAASVFAPALGEVICPPAAAYSPCNCKSDTTLGYSDFIALGCNQLILGQTRIEEILDALLTTPDISPVSNLNLGYNILTRVPRNLNQFKHLSSVALGGNSIQSIPSGSFNLVGYKNQTSKIRLDYNQISTIEAGAFQGNYGEGTQIYLNSNSNLKRLEEDVFLPVLQQMEPYEGYVMQPDGTSNLRSATFINLNNDWIDCVIDPCHLAWLILDNPNMLKNLDEAVCQNGRPLSSLNLNNICQTTTSSTTL